VGEAGSGVRRSSVRARSPSMYETFDRCVSAYRKVDSCFLSSC